MKSTPPSPTHTDLSLSDVKHLMLASIRQQHPEWNASDPEDSPIGRYDQKLDRLLGDFARQESLSPGLAA